MLFDRNQWTKDLFFLHIVDYNNSMNIIKSYYCILYTCIDHFRINGMYREERNDLLRGLHVSRRDGRLP